jgi:hypothetical protein
LSTARITHIGGLTALIEAEGWRLLIDHHGVRQVAKRLKVGLGAASPRRRPVPYFRPGSLHDDCP